MFEGQYTIITSMIWYRLNEVSTNAIQKCLISIFFQFLAVSFILKGQVLLSNFSHMCVSHLSCKIFNFNSTVICDTICPFLNRQGFQFQHNGASTINPNICWWCPFQILSFQLEGLGVWECCTFSGVVC